ncbi:MAG: SUMF1/EgtB/PvdO family nonheme iron enzyme [candidate division KSB1 bacterium]|nr:SUMF1/EgtB/PvdO family nonheme iron enzyme [candidate division KSB1 bacterium]
MRSILLCVVVLFCLSPDHILYPQPDNMQFVEAGEFLYHVEYRWREGLTLDSLIVDDQGMRYRYSCDVDVPAFYMDKNEVTNEDFKRFLDATGYQPQWPENFLKHWKNGTFPRGRGDHPVVWVSLQDAQAYAEWAEKRLPTEVEWQKAAQGPNGLDWPWGNIYDPDKANMDSDATKPVGSYPKGASPYGCMDMAGNVWEWTDSFSSDGYHFFCWIRGGSYFFAKGSRWYMQGGPITTYQRAKFWLMTPALNRSASIGFRCVQDID